MTRLSTHRAGPLAWLAGPLPPVPARRTAVVSIAAGGALLLLLRAAFGLALRTSDDAEMMAVVSGYDGGTPRSELLFTNVILGRILRAAYGLVPDAPWYGLYLHGLQIVAMAVLITSTLVLLERRPRSTAVIAVGAMVLLLPGFMLAVQFTIVAFLVTFAGALLFLALRHRRWTGLSSAAAGAALMTLGLLVRFQSFAATLLMVALLLPTVAVARRRWDVAATALLAVLVATLGGISIAIELRHWDAIGTPRPQSYLTSQLAPTSEGTGGQLTPAAERRAAVRNLTANDRELAGDWLIYPEMLGPRLSDGTSDRAAAIRPDPSTGVDAVTGAVGTAARGVLEPLLRDPIRVLTRTGRLFAGAWWLPALAVVAGMLADGRRARLSALTFAAASVALIGGIGSTRLPDRVLLPMLLLLVIGASVAATGPIDPERPGSRGVRATTLIAMALLMAGVAQQVASTRAWIVEHDWRTARAERFFDELEALDIAPTDTVILWLIDTWWVVDPLGWAQDDEYRDRTIQLAGWQYRLPYRADQRAAYGAEDWIGAVADRDDVLLVAEPERVDRLITLLRERRGRLCSEAILVGSVRGDREVIVQRIDEVPCYGIPVAP